MKLLMITSSTGMDSSYLLPAVAKNEGEEKVVVGILYHSGCRLRQHVQFLSEDAAAYAYFEFDTERQDAWLRADSQGNMLPCVPSAANDKYIEDGSIAQTMKFAIKRHDWDIVMMQGNAYETTNIPDGSFVPALNEDIQTIKNYVLEQDVDKSTTPEFGWNMCWSTHNDSSLWRESDRKKLERMYDGSSLVLYNAIASACRDVIKPEERFTYFMPAATVVKNAEALGMTPAQLHRDYVHASDFTRTMVGYLWYCNLFGKSIDACAFDPIPSKLLFDKSMRNAESDLVLTDEQKRIIRTAIKNSLKNPYTITE